MTPPVELAHLAPVELEDTDDDAVGAGRPPTWVRRHIAWLAGAGAALLLGLVAVQAALDAHERERLEYLADVPGVLSPLHDPPAALRSWAPSAGALVAEDASGHWAIGARYHLGGVDLRGTDPDTGDVLWSVPFSLDDALPPGGRSEFPSVWVRCTTTTSRTALGGLCRGGLPGALRRRPHPAARARPRHRQDPRLPDPGSRLAVVGDGVAPGRRDAAPRQRR